MNENLLVVILVFSALILSVIIFLLIHKYLGNGDLFNE